MDDGISEADPTLKSKLRLRLGLQTLADVETAELLKLEELQRHAKLLEASGAIHSLASAADGCAGKEGRKDLLSSVCFHKGDTRLRDRKRNCKNQRSRNA